MVASNNTIAGPGPVAAWAVAEFELGAAPPPFFVSGLSGPVRQRINPRLAVALIASGAFQIVTTGFAERVDEAKWHYPWSEPVRFKRGLQKYLQRTFTIDTLPFLDRKNMAWHTPFNEPVRQKKGIRSGLQQTWAMDTQFVPVINIGYFSQYSEPVRERQGLKSHLQQSFAYHPRILPNPNVTVTWNSTETGVDVALIAVNVYSAVSAVTVGQGAKVSIVEIAPSGGDPVSIRET